MKRPTSHCAVSAFSAALIAASITMAGCDRIGGAAAPVGSAQANAHPTPPEDPSVLKVRPELAGNLKLAQVELGETWEQRDVPGRIEVDATKVEAIGAAVTGRVVDVNANVGDSVRRGQVLARISSPELTTAQLAYLRASSAQSLAEAAANRARQLLAADVIGSAELQRRQAEAAVARAETNAAADQLRLLGFQEPTLKKLRERGAIEPASNVSTSISGVVIDRKVSQGQVVQPADKLFSVADLTSVWIVGSVPEQAARTIHAGQQVEVDIPASGEPTLPGRVVYVGDLVDPTTRTVQIRSEVQNPDRSLKPGMLATLKVSLKAQSTLVVPIGAIVRDGDQDSVFVKTGDDTFRLVPVELGPLSQGRRAVLKGLDRGTTIVAEGAFHLNNERRRAELE